MLYSTDAQLHSHLMRHGMSGEDQLRRRVWSSPCAHYSTFVLVQAEKDRRTQLAALRKEAAEAAAASDNRQARLDAARCCWGLGL